ncbi:hypothetical protein SAMN05216581_3644 [Pseudomonas asplenii]|uniref:Dermonecrotic toxin N-terminal domain-containing protein n=1 Tax=Pseudomonas asplenii TaxID=53407 RepID=A0A1H6NX08_9PSED|nr:DUF6543 domain-containing protein [Pseudomonas fuscovaginae]SEI18372.1 hypothetical protein SAMN05216581_3644 [Pseudomonas fuscovaginae]
MPQLPELPLMTPLPHERFVRFRLPDWLKNASSRRRNELRQTLIQCHLSAAKIGTLLDPLKSLDEFAEPLLEMDLKADYPELRDMQIATLAKRWHRDSVLWIPIYEASPEHSLLEAALYNFETWETRSSGFGSGSAIYLTGKSRNLKSRLLPEVFAQRCRSLDLGQKYLQHLKQVLDQTDPANEPLVARDKHTYFVEHQRDRFKAVLQMAHLRGDITDECARQLKHFLLPPGKSAGKLLLSRRVMLLGQVLPGVIHFAADPEDEQGKCAVYFPGHREYALREYPSWLTFQMVFMAHLDVPESRHPVTQLMPIDYREPLLMAKLRSAVTASRSPKSDQVSLSQRIEEELFGDIHRQYMLRLGDDLGRLAPAAAKVKAAQREQLLDDYRLAGLDLLATLKGYIPWFKQRLCAPMDLLDAEAIYQDIETWETEERLGGSIHLLNVAEARASDQTTQRMHIDSATLPELVPIRLHGRTRLWKPDPSRYRVDLRVPDGQWQTNGLGLHDWENKTYLLLNQSYYEVSYNEDTHNWHIVSQDQPRLYSPPLRHNGVGAWRALHEDVTQWPEAKLVRRLSAHAAQLPEPMTKALLALSGTRPHTLRQLHRHSRRTPPLLLDSLKRLWILREIERFDLDQTRGNTCTELCSQIQPQLLSLLPDLPRQTPLRIREKKSRKFIHDAKGTPFSDIDEIQWLPGLFDHLYQQLEQPDTLQQQQLRDKYPDLPKSYLADLAFTQQALEPANTTLPALDQEIERAREQIRIARVFEGLYPDWPRPQQSDGLAFSLLETLAPWPQDLRLEFIDAEADPSGVLQSIGVDSSLNYRRLKKNALHYEVQDRQGRTLSTHADFYSAAWQTLPTLTQKQLGLLHGISLVEDEAPVDLKRALFNQASQLRRQTPPVRTQHRVPEPPMSAAAAPLPEAFAVPGRLVSGLQLRDDGVYWNLNRKPASNRAYRHYVLDNRRYYPVHWSPEGWRLLNANNPYGFYQPRLQRKSPRDNRWTLHHPEQEPALLAQAGRLQVLPDQIARDENLQKKMFTPQQRQRLQTPKSYHSCSNSPLTYDRVDNARYPLRDLDGQPMTITALHYSIAEGSPQSMARAVKLLPYLGQGVEVARLYEDQLSIRRFREEHRLTEDEDHLIYRFRVAPRQDLAAGELLGVYGGMLIPLIVSHHRRDPFATWVQNQRSLELIRCPGDQPQAAHACLTGDNILSRINTCFEYEDGVAVRQAENGYNVEAVAFPVDIQTADGRVELDRYHITALFTRQAVKADEELRINHGYTWEQIQTLTSTEPIAPGPTEIS